MSGISDGTNAKPISSRTQNMRIWASLCCIALLTALTPILLDNTDRYEVTDVQLLEDPRFLRKTKFWTNHGSGSVTFGDSSMSVSNQSIGGSHRSNQRVSLDGPGIYKFSIDVKTQDITPGTKSWEAPSTRVFYRDTMGNTIDGDIIVRLFDAQQYSNHSKVILLPNETEIVEISVSLINSVGTISVKNPILSKIEERASYKRHKLILMMVWAGVVAWTVAYLLTSLPLKLMALLSIIGVFTLCGTLLPEHVMTLYLTQIYSLLPSTIELHLERFVSTTITSTNTTVPSAIIGKSGHILAFLSITMACVAYNKRFKLPIIVTAIVLFAAVTEVLQLFTHSRNPSLNDIFIDCLGIFVGIFLGLGLKRFFYQDT